MAAKYSVVAGSGLVDGPMMVALVTNEANTSVRFNLTVIAYQDTVRILMQEFPPLKVARYSVQDVLMPGLERRVRKMESKTSARFLIGTYDKIKVKLQLDQFRLEVLVDGKAAVSINSRDLFNFEHRRGKQVGGLRGVGAGAASPAAAVGAAAGGRAAHWAVWRGAQAGGQRAGRPGRGREPALAARARLCVQQLQRLLAPAHSQACGRTAAAAHGNPMARRLSPHALLPRLPPLPRTRTPPAGGRSRSTATRTASPRAQRPSRWTSPSPVRQPPLRLLAAGAACWRCCGACGCS